MIICDTSIWIEYFRKNAVYFEQVSILLNQGEIFGLELIFGELLQGITEKNERRVILQCWDGIPKYSEPGLWLVAGEYAAIHRVSTKGIGLIDAYIAVAALNSNSLLWSLDKKLISLMPQKHRYD